MTGIALTAGGLLLMVAGFVFYFKSKKGTPKAPNIDKLQHVVKMSLADGVLTANERAILKQLALANNLDPNEIIAQAEQQIAICFNRASTRFAPEINFGCQSNRLALF